MIEVDGVRVMTAVELAELAGVTQTRIRALCAGGKLNARKIGRDWLIPEDAARAWLASETRRQFGARIYRDRLAAKDAAGEP
jgi:excisionase family DNA binding protein